MKKRLAKKIEKMRRKKVHEALEIVLEINTTQARAQSKTGCSLQRSSNLTVMLEVWVLLYTQMDGKNGEAHLTNLKSIWHALKLTEA